MTERAKENERNNYQQHGPDKQTHIEESAPENITEGARENETQNYQQRGLDKQGIWKRVRQKI